MTERISEEAERRDTADTPKKASAVLAGIAEANRTVARLLDGSGGPSQDMLELLSLYGIEGCGTVEDVKDATQAQWYEKGKLRAEIVERHGEHREPALSLLRKMGFFEAWHAEAGSYDDMGVLGATVVAVRKRVAFLTEEWNRGVRFARLSFLGSSRPLLEGKESPSVLLNGQNAELPFPGHWTSHGALPTDEAGMMETVLDQAQVARVPWGGVPSFILRTLPQTGRNATTADTLRDWAGQEGADQRKNVVFASSQPFVPFQDLVTRNTLPSSYRIQTVGPAGGETLPMTVHLDNVAKIVYEIVEAKQRIVL